MENQLPGAIPAEFRPPQAQTIQPQQASVPLTSAELINQLRAERLEHEKAAYQATEAMAEIDKKIREQTPAVVEKLRELRFTLDEYLLLVEGEE